MLFIYAVHASTSSARTEQAECGEPVEPQAQGERNRPNVVSQSNHRLRVNGESKGSGRAEKAYLNNIAINPVKLNRLDSVE